MLGCRTFIQAATLACALVAVSAEAQTAPAVEQHSEQVAAPPEVPTQTVISITAGATLNTGNTKAYAGNLGGRIGVMRHPHQFTVEALGTLGATENQTTKEIEKTAANAIGRARYDLFLSQEDALFAAIQPRRDTFAGLNLRLQMQAGYARNLYHASDDHRLWTELGYDLTYDNFARVPIHGTDDLTDQVVVTPGPDVSSDFKVPSNARVVSDTTTYSRPPADFVHSARVFLGYTNRLHAAANLNLGVETLFDVEDKKNVRVTGMAELTTSVSENFKLGVQARLFFDNVPVPEKGRADGMVALQLVYTFDSLAGAPPPPEPVCECTAEVEAAKLACAESVSEPPAEEVPVEAPAPPATDAPAPEAPEGTESVPEGAESAPEGTESVPEGAESAPEGTESTPTTAA